MPASKYVSPLPPAAGMQRGTNQYSSPATHMAGNGGEHFNVVGYQSNTPRGSARASRPPQQLTRFTWDRHSMWVEEPVEKRLPGGAKRSVLPPRQDPAVTDAMAMQQNPADDYQLHRQAELWTQVVLPAVTWLYGWVDWQINSKSREVPSIVDREHRAAFAAATEHVTLVMKEQPDRLSACIWRAMIALLTHFSTRIEPLVKTIEALQAEVKAHKQTIEELSLNQRSDSESSDEEQDEASEGGSSPTLLPPIDDPLASVQEDEPSFERRQPDRMGRRGSMRRGSILPPPPAFAQSAQETEELRERVVSLQRDLIAERSNKASLEQALKRAKAGGDNGAPPTIDETRSGRRARTDEPLANATDALDDESDEAMMQKAKRRGRRSTIQDMEANMLERVDADLQSEKKRRLFLENVRTALGGALGEDWLQSIETIVVKNQEEEERQRQKEEEGEGQDTPRLPVTSDGPAAAAAGVVDLTNSSQLSQAGLPKLPDSILKSLAKPQMADTATQWTHDDAGKASQLEVADSDDEGEGTNACSSIDDTASGDIEVRKAKTSLRSSKSSDSNSGSPTVSGKLKGKGRSKEASMQILNMKQIENFIRNIYDDKLKRDGIDELEHRPKMPLAQFVPDYFTNRHGLEKVANKHLVTFRDGIKNSAIAGNRRSFIFAGLAGYLPFEGDGLGYMQEPMSLSFFIEFERKAMTATDRSSDGQQNWMQIDRAIELFRNEFKHARITDISKATQQIEELVRLPDEVVELRAMSKELSNFKVSGDGGKGDNKMALATSLLGGTGKGGSKDASGPTSTTNLGSLSEAVRVPKGFFDRTGDANFYSKTEEQRETILKRREEALVQNKVMRALNRRGLSLRELFTKLDKEQAGEIPSEDFVKGVQELEGQLSDEQCKRLMEITDVDGNGSIDFNELTKGLQKLDLRVDVNDFILNVLRFYCSEMQRSVQVLRSKFQQAAKKEGATPDSPAGELSNDGVKVLLKQLDAPFTPGVVQRMLIEMGRESRGLSIRVSGKSKSDGAAEASTTSVAVEPFIRSVMANGFHAISHAAFKEMGQALNSATQALMAVSAFSKKLGGGGLFKKPAAAPPPEGDTPAAKAAEQES